MRLKPADQDEDEHPTCDHASPDGTAPGNTTARRNSRILNPRIPCKEALFPRLPQRRPDALLLGVELDRVLAHLAAPAAGLEAAPGGDGVDRIRHVDPDRAGPDPGGEAMGSGDVSRPDRRAEAVLGVVRPCDQ